MATPTPTQELFSRFVPEIGLRLQLPRLSRRVLKRFSEGDVKAGELAAALAENGYYQNVVVRAAGGARDAKDAPMPTESAILRLGMQRARDLICAAQLARHIRRTHIKFDANGKIQLNPAEVLKFAAATEEAASAYRPSFSDAAFAAGMVFDALREIAVHQLKSPKSVIEFLEQTHKHGVLAAKIGVEVAKGVPEATAPRFVFSACLLHNVGKAVLAMLDPHYPDFLEKCKKAQIPRAARHFFEQKRYTLTHEAYSAFCVEFFPTLSITRDAILCHHQPHALLKANREQYVLSGLICMATNMATNWTVPKNAADPVVATWLGPELKGFPVKAEALVRVAGKLQGK